MKEFKGKVAVVTGAASGIGKAMAKRFGEEGMRLLLSDIDAEGLEAVGQEFDSQGYEVQTWRTDVSKASQLEALADFAYERFGDVNVLCNNAGVAVVGAAWECSQADWEWALGVNLWSVIHAIRAFVPKMLERDQPGHIVNTASIAGLLCPPLSGPYVTTKHAVVALSECLHHDLATVESKLRVSVLCPGFVQTGIANSERSRPESMRDLSPRSGNLARIAGAYYKRGVAEGIEAIDVAGAIYDAIVEERFYVFTHPEHAKVFRKRFDGIVESKNPSTPNLNEL